ncbi:MAG: DUF3124 domain-containing protein [Sulfuricella sp.]|nr:DUF3124 domain-containing protein [Sulfuricella sp.]
MKTSRTFRFLSLVAVLLPSFAAFAEEPALSRGQALYLPIYSHVWHGDIQDRYPLKSQVSALVSIRNTDAQLPIRILSARYYDTAGKMLKEYLPSPKTIPPMATHELYVEKKEAAGGSGANFIIQWDAGAPANLPVVEAVHADIQGHRTFAFVTTARPVRLEH